MADTEVELRAEVEFDLPVSTITLVLDSSDGFESSRDWVVCVESADGSPRIQESGHNWFFSRLLDSAYLYLEAEGENRVRLRPLKLDSDIRRAAICLRPWTREAHRGERMLPEMRLLAQGLQGRGTSQLSVYTETAFGGRA